MKKWTLVTVVASSDDRDRVFTCARRRDRAGCCSAGDGAHAPTVRYPRPRTASSKPHRNQQRCRPRRLVKPRRSVYRSRELVLAPAARPVEITIPSIRVDSLLISLDRNAGASIQVPDSFDIAGWYDHSVTPEGERADHHFRPVDSESGPASSTGSAPCSRATSSTSNGPTPRSSPSRSPEYVSAPKHNFPHSMSTATRRSPRSAS